MLEFEISEVSKITKLKSHTLRYYESIGLIKDIKRNTAGKRVYTEDDLKWLEVINRLRETGMNIRQMQEYARLRHMGDETISERKIIMENHLESINREIDKLLEARDYVEKKIKIYNEMEEKINERRK
ncbi:MULTISPECIES: MerR family transcriptional regulator [unclassified Clostridium]|uniref:MerR family transcriptional regulator n=1 Tax=unclassified Clostridium TaxID=2614128 RepID=UPI000297ACA9|nr:MULTISPECIES: MerR family transcriptional regulator [unclassified Clostridium]EKQ51260.1 MAG: putative transcriptional regulator [Clostridium sp. Maddingley MBC34-26]